MVDGKGSILRSESGASCWISNGATTDRPLYSSVGETNVGGNSAMSRKGDIYTPTLIEFTHTRSRKSSQI